MGGDKNVIKCKGKDGINIKSNANGSHLPMYDKSCPYTQQEATLGTKMVMVNNETSEDEEYLWIWNISEDVWVWWGRVS